MNKKPKNLFPAVIGKGVIEIFGEQPIQHVLLQLLPTTTVDEHPQFDSYLNEIFHPKEAAAFYGYTLTKRRSEYLTGRLCGKFVVQGFSNLTKPHAPPLILSEIEIDNTEKGRPTVLIYSAKAEPPLKMDISIAHSGDYGVALAAGSRCGIDLQQQKATLLRVQEKYCSKTEYHLLETFLTNTDTLTRLAILWAAKEAAKKALSHWQMPGFLDLELWDLKQVFTDCLALSMHVIHTKNRQIPKEVTVAAGMFGEYALAVCIVNEDCCDAGITRS